MGPPRGGIDLSFLGGLGGVALQISVILIIRGAARGAAAGRYRSLVFGGSGGRSPPDFCYLDNIEITEAKREILLFHAA
nr:MAG TPA: hypothetical protein [Inoviridae sp.]